MAKTNEYGFTFEEWEKLTTNEKKNIKYLIDNDLFYNMSGLSDRQWKKTPMYKRYQYCVEYHNWIYKVKKRAPVKQDAEHLALVARLKKVVDSLK